MSQLALFDAPHKSPLDRQKAILNLAFSDSVRDEILALAGARKGEWLAWNDFRSIFEKHKIGFCFGHVLYRISRTGLIEEDKVYFGTKHLGPDYRGFGNRWRVTA